MNTFLRGERMRGKTCCVTGHRDIPAEQIEYVKQALRREIEGAIADGYTHFLSGFAEGADLFFAEIAAEFCEKNEALTLEGAIPYEGRLRRLQKGKETKRLLDACDKISLISKAYAPDVFHKRNQYLIEHSQRAIAVYDGRERGGTAATLRMARRKEIELRIIYIGIYIGIE